MTSSEWSVVLKYRDRPACWMIFRDVSLPEIPKLIEKEMKLDVVQLSIILWIISGLYIWWKLPRFRFWGWVSLAGGMAGFVALALSL